MLKDKQVERLKVGNRQKAGKMDNDRIRECKEPKILKKPEKTRVF